MDITQGEFKDIYPSSNGRNSRTHSRLSMNEGVCSSLELLPSEEHHDTGKFTSELITNGNNMHFDESENGRLTSASNYDAVNVLNQIATKSKFLSSSLSDNSALSSSSDTESFETLRPDSDAEPLQMQLSQEEIEMQKAIKKMQKLDQILMSKMKHEREVKRQRLLIQKNFYSDLEKLEAENKNASYSDITNNTSKYLALLPPSQQLDVLLEQHQAVEDFEPIFQTQLYSTHSIPSVEQTSEKSVSEEHRPKSEEKSENREKLKREKKTRSAGTKSKHKDNGKTNFIERNIELAKDAGSMVAMTEEEKKRLEELLEDAEEEELPLEDQDSDNTPSQLMATRFGQGFTPEQREAEHLQEIDSRLKTFLSPAVFTSISSTSLMHRTIPNTSSEMRDIGRKIAKANVAETLTPAQRLNEIEDKLSRLNEKWKEKCDVMPPRLSDEQLHRLLDEYSRSTSPNSIVTSNLSKLDFRHDDRSSPISFVSNPSEVVRSSFDLPPEESRCSSRSSDATLTSERDSVVSKPPVLKKSVLDKLLHEAKESLGIPDTEEDIEEAIDSANQFPSVTPDIEGNT